MAHVLPRGLALLAVTGLAAALLAAPPARAEAVSSQLDMMRQALPVDVGSLVAPQGGSELGYSGVDDCIADPAGDSVRLSDGSQPGGAEPRADIVESCVNYGASLSLSLRLAAPTDPRTDAGWQGATFAGWFISTDGDPSDVEYFVQYNLDANGDLVGIVSDVSDGGQEPTCTVSPTFTGYHQVSGIAPSCLGGATSIQVAAAMFYDTQPNTAGDQGVWFDRAPDDGAPGAAVARTPRQSARLSIPGQGRIHTAVAISRDEFTNPAAVAKVFLARADDFPDALAGGALTGGPILLVPTTGALPPIVAEEIARLNPQTVLALGGTSAVSNEMLAQAAAGRQSARLARPGTGRTETAVEISRHQFPDPAAATEVYLARADAFPDALAGGTLTRGPILLVPRTGAVPAVVQEEIARLNPQRVVALGGEAAVHGEVLTAAAAGRQQVRLSIPGGGRLQTAIAISRFQFPRTTDGGDVYLARADDFPDALAGGALTRGSILLVPRTGTLPPDVAAEISRLNPRRVVALGGAAAVSAEILQQAVDA